nr:MAG TPA: hypothetical protein [Microviridae sp.]
MIKPTFFPKPPKTNYELQEGETIEEKVKRITENNEPITDGAPIIYTNRDDGVLPAYNIRTDRWDIAQQAMDAVNQANLAKSKSYGKIEQQEQNALDSKEVGDTSSQQESVG